MDDEDIYGPVFYHLSFSDALSMPEPLLADYKVLIVAVDEQHH